MSRLRVEIKSQIRTSFWTSRWLHCARPSPRHPAELQYSDGMGNFGDIVMIPKQVTCRARAKGFKGSDIRKCMDMSMLLESPGFVQGAPSVLYLHMSPQRSWRGQLFLLWCACLMPLGGIGVKTFSGHFDTQLCQDTRAMQGKSCTQRLSLACSRTSPRFSSHPRASQARAAQSSKKLGFWVQSARKAFGFAAWI